MISRDIKITTNLNASDTNIVGVVYAYHDTLDQATVPAGSDYRLIFKFWDGLV